MRKSGWKNLRTVFVILAGAIALAACGGGGGSSSGGNSPAGYSGNTQAAVIDAQTAGEIALGAYEAGELQAEMGIAPTGAMGSLALAETFSASLAAQDLAQAASVSTAMQTQTTHGDCGGSMTQSISSDASGNFSGSMNFANYCSADVTMNGSMTFSGAYDINAQTMSFTLNFNSLTTTMGGESFTSSGSMSMNISMDMENPGPGSYTMNMVVIDPVTGEDCWLKDYTMTMTPGSGSSDVTVSGRFYHYEFGYVDISTVQDIQVPDYGDYPQSGVIRFDGADGTWATLTFTGSGGYTVAASDGTTVSEYL